MGNHICIKKAWNEWSDTRFVKYRSDERIAKLIENPESAFHHMTYAMLQEIIPNYQGKRICVPSSGDNHAVFSFCLMGAKVTSVDISERQLENGALIAQKHGWDIEFICDDTMELSNIQSGEYDLVYTSNGVHVWINDLYSMYRNISRILKPGGSYLMYDVHPFTRPFEDRTDQITVVKPYDSIGPFGEIPRYTWRMQDLINAMISSGLNINRLEEMYAEYNTYWFEVSGEREKMTKEEIDKLYQWEHNPLAATPQWLSVYAVRN
ncbi:class I SAM-dependent methyltransferase [Paenibacillus sp.]|jgi:SAM-dependent methyltransferase|uniref:class I SAM-dependent methyltransferase n=1 Tax=Paenibacillus sp. TaxID=58172 RepID=UPI0028366F92|nr:class I SAM-dependent methyltransferase [Paenibacillus sp.]MDR0267787.1 class I SAM-dependent methyltransferase [Paenibacillus sp.]